MNYDFIFEIARLRVLFGAGRRNALADELQRLGLERAMLIADVSQTNVAEALARTLGERSTGVYDRVVQHVPAEVAAAGAEHARRVQADCTVCIGGGSAIGLAKAIALETSLPIIAIPTTYAGSEMTPIWGLTADGRKKTGRDERVQPKVAIYDADLLTTLPPEVAGPSGINALAHAVEGLYAENVNPMMSAFAQESVRAIAASLPTVVRERGNVGAQSEVQYGACLAGIILGSVGMALHHKLCHVLGGTFNTPHADTHALILPYVAAYNLPAAADARRRLQDALRADDVAGALWTLGRDCGAPQSLAALGLTEQDLETAADLATAQPYFNPREVTRSGVLGLLQGAYRGERPTS